MAQAAQIEIGVSRAKAVADLKGIRKELQALTRDVSKLNKTWQGLGTTLNKQAKQTKTVATAMTRVDKIAKSSTTGLSGLGKKFKELGQSATIALGPLSGITARLSAFNSLTKTASLSTAALTVAVISIGALLLRTAGIYREYEVQLDKIQKVTSLTESETLALGKSLRFVAARTGIARQELLGIAEVGGRLGIDGVANLTLFSETIANVALASDLTGEQAATSLARILKVTNESVDQIDELGNVIIRLGNNVAAEESEITEFANAVARASGVFGIASTDAAALGAAMAQLGIKVESGSTAISRVFGSFDRIVAQGGLALRNLESLVGLDATNLTDLLKSDPLIFFARFIQGLKLLGDQQGEAAALNALKDFGISGEREAKALRPLINNFSELERIIGLARNELTQMNAAANEAETATDNLDGDIKRLKETFDNLLIDIFGGSLNQGLRLLVMGFDRMLIKIRMFANAVSGLFKTTILSQLELLNSIPGVDFNTADLQKSIQVAREEAKALEKNLEAVEARMRNLENDSKGAANEVENLTAALGDQNRNIRNIPEAWRGISDAIGDTLQRTQDFQNVFSKGFVFVSTDQVKALAEARKLLNFEDVPTQSLDEFAKFIEEDLGIKLPQAIVETLNLVEKLGIAVPETLRDELIELVASFKVAEAEAQLLAKKIQTALNSAAQNFADTFKSTFKKLFKGDLDNIFQEFIDGILDTFAGLAAELVTMQITGSVIQPLFSSFARSAGFGQSAIDAAFQNVTGLPAGFESPAGGGVFSLFGQSVAAFTNVIDDFGKSIGFFQEIPKFIEERDLNTGEVIGRIADGTEKIGNLTGRLLEGLAVNQIFGNQGFLANAVGTLASAGLGSLGESIGQSVAETIGDTVGDILGDLLPVVGEIIGALIGALFSKDPTGIVSLGAVQSGLALGITGTQAEGPNPPLDQAIQSANQIIDILNKVADTLGASFTGLSAQFQITQGTKTPFASIVGGQKSLFKSGQEALLDLVKRFILQGGFSEIPPAVKQVVQNSLNSDLQELFENIQFAVAFERAFDVLDGALTSVEKAVKDLNAQFDEFARTAKKLGLAEERVNQARQVAILQLRGDFESDIKLAILQLTDPLEAALYQQQLVEEERVKNAQALGASITAVELLGQLERQKIMEDFANSATNTLRTAFSTIKDFLTEITATTQSNLPLPTVLANAQARFTDLRAAFLGGDTSVANDLVDASRELLGLSRQADASGPGFFSTQALVEDTLRQALALEETLDINELQLEALNTINNSIQEGNDLLALLTAILSQPSSSGNNGGTTPVPPILRDPTDQASDSSIIRRGQTAAAAATPIVPLPPIVR